MKKVFEHEPNVLTLADYFAAKAMQGMLADPNVLAEDPAKFAERCYQFAEAMIQARYEKDAGDDE